jgi:hypothetical protein
MRMRLSYVLFALVVLGCAAAVVVYARNRPREAAPPFAAGPFTVETLETRISTGAFPNTSGNPFATRPLVQYAVRYRGQVVGVPVDGDDPQEAFWDARVLADAPRPAVLVGSLGVWLVTEGEGQPAITTLAAPTDDFATLQWLDVDGGQPGAEITLSMLDAPTSPRALSGGRRLLVNRRTVLDVSTLQVREITPTAYNPDLDGYSPSGESVRMTSPDGRQVVFAATRNAGEGYGYDFALVAVDVETNRAYAVPFLRTPTRFGSVWDIDRAWLAHYFDWRPGDDGLRLHYRDDVEPLPWHGRVTHFSGDMVEYRIDPVAVEMQALLAGFIERTEAAERLPGEDGRLLLKAGEDVLNVSYDAERRSVVLYAEPSSPRLPGAARIERIAKAFDTELATRRHDALFGSLEGAP